MGTFNKFIDDRGLTMNTIYVGTSENDTRFDWIVTVRMGDKEMRADFHMGMAHCKIVPSIGSPYGNINKIKWQAKKIKQLELFGKVVPTKPILSDVLWSLQSDASVKDNYPDKRDFINEMGYDGREGERIYNLCIAEYHKIREFFGKLYSEFMELEED